MEIPISGLAQRTMKEQAAEIHDADSGPSIPESSLCRTKHKLVEVRNEIGSEFLLWLPKQQAAMQVRLQGYNLL